jgi:hypothetical protein
LCNDPCIKRYLLYWFVFYLFFFFFLSLSFCLFYLCEEL